jgi:uncharacterized protein YbjT (DUF2867 family)
MRTILVAGATGIVGRAVTQLLRNCNYRIRTLSRDPGRAHVLRNIADEVVLGDATKSRSLEGALTGVDAVISCLGAPVNFAWTERRGFHAVDTVANCNLIQAALKAGVTRFIYVSVHVQPGYAATAYVRAHEAVVTALSESGLSYAVVRPTGIFPIFDSFVTMARYGIAAIPGDGTARTNPVHQLDVAEACADALTAEPGSSIAIGGPDIFTREELVGLAFEAASKRPRIIHAPRSLVLATGAIVRPFHPHIGEVIDFAAHVFTAECVAPQRGRRRLMDYFTHVASTTV